MPSHSIAFVAVTAYPVLAGDRALRFVGGAEVQQVAIATELARRGHRVSMICHDHGQPDGEVIRGVRVIKTCGPTDGLPVLRFAHPRLTSLWSAMKRADADVYYQRTSGAATAFVAAFAQRHGRASVFAGAHDADFEPDLPLVQFGRDRALYRWGVRRVTRVVAQTEHQRRRCTEVFGRDAVRIDSCYAHAGEPARHDGVVLWVATIKTMKRPDLFLDVAARLPSYRFRLVGGPGGNAQDQALYAQLQQRAKSLPNVELTGFVAFADVEQHFDGASVFVNTSSGEGFPNTFLQAWSRGVPTVSFFDPGSELDGQPVANVVGDVEQMAAAIASLKSDATAWEQAGRRARAHFELKHSAKRVVDGYEQLFDEALAACRPRERTMASPAKP